MKNGWKENKILHNAVANTLIYVIAIPERTTATDRIIKLPENKPTLKVVHGLWCSPSGGTRRRFMARCRSPPSRSFVTVASVSCINLSISLDVKKCDVSTHSTLHFEPASTDNNWKKYDNTFIKIGAHCVTKTTRSMKTIIDFYFDVQGIWILCHV